MEVSLFQNFTTKRPLSSTLEAVAAMIKADEHIRALTESYRVTKNKDVKASSPLFGVAARFEGGKTKGDITRLTGLSLVDVDGPHLLPPSPKGEGEASGGWSLLAELWEKAVADPHTLLCYRTISGQGLRVIFRYELDGSFPLEQQMQWYPKAFAAGNAYYAELLGVDTDLQCKNVGRLSGLAHDPEVYLNLDAVPFSAEEIEEVARETLKQQRATKRQSRERARLERTYEHKVRPEVEADGAVYAPGHHNDYVMRVGYKLCHMRFSEETAVAWALEKFPDYAETEAVIRACYKTHPQPLPWREGSTGSTRVEQIAAFLKGKGLRWDALSRKIQIGSEGWTELTERGMNDLFIECCQALCTNLNFQDFRHVLNSGVVPEVNPLREYILSLPEWDGKDYIAEVANMVKTEGTLWENCFRKWFCAMVAAWMDDRVVNHQVLVLIGMQGIFKTTWLDALMPPELAQYRCRQSGARALDKDEQLRATEFGLINMDEIDRMSEQELNALKSLITASDINVRAAYAQSKERRLRVASYVASGNKEQFLTDTTGNRRWLPFHVEAIDSPFEHPLPYAGMYAQAWALVRQGFSYWFSLDDIQTVANHVDAFTVESNEEQLLPVYFAPCQPGTNGAMLLTVAEISAKLTMYGNIRKPLDVRQLGALLKKMGFVQLRLPKHGSRGYIVLENSAESINAKRRLSAMGVQQ